MLTWPERIAFIIFVLASLSLTFYGFNQIRRAIRRGHGEFPWKQYLKEWKERLLVQVLQVGTTFPVFMQRPLVGLFHFMIFAGFSFYFLVNVSDIVEGFNAGYTTLHQGMIFALYDLAADLLSIGVLVGMAALLIRRFVLKDQKLTIRENVLLDPKVRSGAVRRDSLIVGAFILFHVGSRWLGQAFQLAATGRGDFFEPTASVVSAALMFLPRGMLEIGVHVTWWAAIGLIFLFFPYFVFSKHIHIFFAPLNWLLYPERNYNVTAASNGHLGAKTMQDMSWHSIMDAYACIMCNRCQDVCPGYASGTSLSPSALEVNKRYWLNGHLSEFANGKSSPPLLDFAISLEAVWACTTCGACVEVCPVGNAPMVDIIDIRRALINDGAALDANLQKSLENLGKQGNSFGQSARARSKWTQGLEFKIKDARKEEVEYLWFVGDYASFDPRGQQLTRLVAQVFQQADLDFGILHEGEWNSGNDVRRVGEEGLFEMLAEHNIAALEKAKFSEGIITTDPHSMNALRFEYAKTGKQYRVAHYTQVLNFLLDEGRLAFKRTLPYRVTYHDPCYLGRYNLVVQPPRKLLERLGVEFIEMPRNSLTSYCCGAGGGQIWKGENNQTERPSEQRIREALGVLEQPFAPKDAPAPLFVVACPKDVAMYTDAVKASGNEGKLVVKDIIELVKEALEEKGKLTSAMPPAAHPKKLTRADEDAKTREVEVA
jgi:Fe-S oxidoreductase